MDEFPYTFGQRLKILRMRANLQQSELADKCGVTYSTVSNWELDYHKPPFNKMLLLSEALRISLDELVGRTPSKFSEKAYEAISLFDDLDDESQDFILNMMKTLPHRPGR